MRRRLLAFVMLTMMPVFVAGQGAAHSTKSQKSVYTPPRTPWGDPDLQGVWPGTAMMGVPQERPAQFGERAVVTDEEFAARLAQAKRQADAANEEFVAVRASGGPPGNTGGPGHWGERGLPQRQTSLIVDPPDGRMPAMTPEGGSTRRQDACNDAGRTAADGGHSGQPVLRQQRRRGVQRSARAVERRWCSEAGRSGILARHPCQPGAALRDLRHESRLRDTS